jgi:hypothetical protein
VHPGEEPLYFPATAIAPQFPSVPTLASPPPVGRDQLDAVLFGEFLVELVRVVGFVADEPDRELVEEASSKNLFHKLALRWRIAIDPERERQ